MKKLKKEDIEGWLKEDGRGISIVSEYTSTRVKTTFECSSGHRWEATPNAIKNGKGCPVCDSFTETDMSNWLLDSGNGIVMIGKYGGTKIKTKFQCQHGHQWDARPDNIKKGDNCPICSVKNRSISTEEFSEWLMNKDSGVKLLSNYINAHSKITLRCENEHEWETTPNTIKNGRGRCPKCYPINPKKGFNPNKPGWIYVLVFGDFIKYGITNNLQQRLKKHLRNGNYVVGHTHRYEIGQHALDWENHIKRTHGGRYVTKEQCPDGYTETLPINSMEWIVKTTTSEFS